MKDKSRAIPELRFNSYTELWKTHRLKNFIKSLHSGVSVNSTDIKADHNEFGILKTSAVYQGVFKSYENKKIIDEEVARARLNPLKDTLLISRMNTPELVGEIAYVEKDYKNLFIPDRLWLTESTDNIVVRWLAYYLTTPGKRSAISSIATGTSGSMKNISKPNFLSLVINVPSKEEQQKIADFLSAVDERIHLLQEKKENLVQYKKGVMQKLFPKAGQTNPELRFKGDDGKEFPDWEEMELGKYSIVNPSVTDLPNKFIYIDLESVDKGRLTKKEYVTKENAPSRAQRKLKTNDILFQTVRPYQMNNYFFIHREGEYVASTGYAQIRSKLPQFLYCMLHTTEFVNEVLRRCTGTSYPAISSSDLSSIFIKIPLEKEQRKIAQFLADIDNCIHQLSGQIEKTQAFKKGLLQKMFV